MAIQKRCILCHKVLRTDSTCQNEKCVRYVPEVKEEATKDNGKKK